MNLVEQTLLRLGGHVANISYQRFLHVMDLILQQDVFPSGQLMSKIYSQAARDLDVSRDVLVRSVARVVDDMWYNGNFRSAANLPQRGDKRDCVWPFRHSMGKWCGLQRKRSWNFCKFS
ncbi:hypothetical protein AAK912_10945 [Merdimmobilis hominis]|uniref:hypothetical protein n=1 Tax=Merdimmobilis hominis TaxID=2897707 RepID=UPI003510E9A6